LRLFAAACLLCCACFSVAAAELEAEGTLEVLFSPWDDAEGRLITTIGNARQSIHVQAYLLTSRSIAKALMQAHQRGVRVRVLTDDEMLANNEHSQIHKLAAAGIPVWLETRYANAHNKVMLIDAEGVHPAVITGSYNFTWSAQARNAENMLILRDNPALAEAYLKNWQRHRRDARPYEAALMNGK
jgi:phosphatidylserine/phosphatidylglycerophosphate/cardiolipin synthase-like enzyme